MEKKILLFAIPSVISIMLLIGVLAQQSNDNSIVIRGRADISEIRFVNASDLDLVQGDVVCFQVNESVGACQDAADPSVAGIKTDSAAIQFITQTVNDLLTADPSLANNITQVGIKGIIFANVDCSKNAVKIGDNLISAKTRGNLVNLANVSNKILSPIDGWDIIGKISASIIAKALTSCNEGDGVVSLQVMVG